MPALSETVPPAFAGTPYLVESTAFNLISGTKH